VHIGLSCGLIEFLVLGGVGRCFVRYTVLFVFVSPVPFYDVSSVILYYSFFLSRPYMTYDMCVGGRQEFLMKGDCLTTMGNALEFAKVSHSSVILYYSFF
jgi:hypothetical protein